MPKVTNNINGYLLFYKKSGVTSFESLYQVKKALGTGKVGHTGTLDKFAEGLLVLLTGTYTSLVPLFDDLDKTYIGTIHFGLETDTLDPEGNVIGTAPVPTKERIMESLQSFVGIQSQLPPAYSAIHVDGKRAYERVRAGEDVKMEPRTITIHSIEALAIEDNRLTVAVHCSKGTYIRSLARDIGIKTGSCAYLEKLRRIGVGPFSVESAVIAEGGAAGFSAIKDALKPVNMDLFHTMGYPALQLDDSDMAYILHGRPLNPLLKGYKLPEGTHLLGLFDKNNTLRALVEKGTYSWSYKHMYPH